LHTKVYKTKIKKDNNLNNKFQVSKATEENRTKTFTLCLERNGVEWREERQGTKIKFVDLSVLLVFRTTKIL